MTWCFSTRASVATMLTTHPCVSRCLRVNQSHHILCQIATLKCRLYYFPLQGQHQNLFAWWQHQFYWYPHWDPISFNTYSICCDNFEDLAQFQTVTQEWQQTITPTPYMVLPLFATRFAAYAGCIRVSFIQPRLFQFDMKCSAWEIYNTDLHGWNL